MDERDVPIEYWAAWFWKRAGGRKALPANIEYAAKSALEVSIEEVDGLTVSKAISLFRGAERSNRADMSERRLRGCVSVTPKGAIIFVEERDDEAQRRFTVAHEVAHFILEVKSRRERAEARLGRGSVDVLNGLRNATRTELIDAWLHEVRLDPILHLMDRAPDGGHQCERTRDAECVADDLAVEMLAPRAEMANAVLSLGSLGFSETLDKAGRIAERRFGLPKQIAERYAGRLVWQVKGGPSSAERFGFAR